MSYFNKNLAAIELREPELAKRLLHAPDDPNIRLIENGNGKSIEVKLNDGAEVLFKREAVAPNVRSITEKKLFSFSEVIILIGAGLGETLVETLKSSEKTAFVLLIEADTSYFKKLLEAYDLSDSLSDPRLSLSVGEKPIDAVMIRLENEFGVFTRPNFQLIKHLKSIACRPDYYGEIDTVIAHQKAMAENNLTSISMLSGMWQKNIFANMPYILKSPGIKQMFGKMKGIPAVIVAAGPSLDKNCRWLKKAEDSMVILCVDTSLKTLAKNNIRPHFVFSLDAMLENYSHVSGVDTSGYNLIVNPVTYPLIISEHKGPMMVTSYTEPLVTWLETYTGDLGVNVTGGSVATAAFDFAYRLGCSPIILTGQDLAFSGGRTHSSGGAKQEILYTSMVEPATLDDMHGRTVTNEKQSETKGNLGHQLKTTIKMRTWKSWFEVRLEKDSIKCINATEGGAVIKGAKKLSLQQAIFKYSGKRGNLDEVIKRCATARVPADLKTVTGKLEKLADRSRDIKKVCGLGIKEARKIQKAAQKKGSEKEVGETTKNCVNYIKYIMKESEFLSISHWRLENMMDKIQRLQAGVKSSEPRKQSYINADSYLMFFREIYEVTKEFEKNVKSLKSNGTSAGKERHVYAG